MADYETLFPGRFLKSADLAERDATVTIKSVVGEEIDGKAKVIISFEGTKKQFVCNRTNAEAIRLMHGRELNGWLGKRITLGRIMMTDPFDSSDTPQQIGAIRVKGSPDIDAPMSAEVKRGRKTLKISVKPTGAKAPAKPTGNGKPAAQTAAPPPMSDADKAAALAAEREQEGLPGEPGANG